MRNGNQNQIMDGMEHNKKKIVSQVADNAQCVCYLNVGFCFAVTTLIEYKLTAFTMLEFK